MTTFTLSPDQAIVLDHIHKWLDKGGRVLTLGGLAGTGKTTIVAVMVNEISDAYKVQYCAPTGKAVVRLQQNLPTHLKAKTLHSLLYKPMDDHCDACPVTEDSLADCHATTKSNCGCEVSYLNARPGDEAKPVLYICDEASMVDGNLFEDLCELAAANYGRILFVGDHGQLPPVQSSFNLMDDPDIKLEKIHRQAEGSAILKLALMARDTGRIPFGIFSDTVRKVKLRDFDFQFDLDETLMLAHTNKRCAFWNDFIRKAQGLSGMPKPGERVICLRNNWNKDIQNGLMGTVIAMRKHINPKLYHADIMLETGKHFIGDVSAEQFGNPETFVKVQGDLFNFGYCITVHKAQGSQAKRIILMQPPYTPSNNKKWLYTAITRAQEELIIIEDED